MSNITISYKNYKLVKEEILKLKHGHLHLIKGKGNKGKTSRVNGFLSLLTAKDDTMLPITHGETEAEIKLAGWKNEDGEDITVTRKLSTGSKDIYTMEVGKKKIRSVGEIRDQFGHIEFDVIDFIRSSMNAGGRDDQRELILNLLSIEDKKKFFKFEKIYELAVDVRKKNKKLLASAKTLMKSSTLTKDEEVKLTHKEAATELKESLEKEISEVELNKEKIKNITNFISVFNSNIESAKKDLDEDFVVKLEELRNQVEAKYTTKLNDLPEVDELSITEKKERIIKGKALLNDINTIEIKQGKLEDYTKEFNHMTEIVDLNEAKVACIKAAKDKFMTTVKLPIEGLVIGTREEGLFYMQDDVLLPFNEKQLSKTAIYRISIQIAANINKKSKVVLLGDASRMDDDFKLEVAQYAKDNDLLIIADQVTNDDEVSVEIVDVKESKTTTKSTPKATKTPKKKPEAKVEVKKTEDTKTKQLLF